MNSLRSKYVRVAPQQVQAESRMLNVARNCSNRVFMALGELWTCIEAALPARAKAVHLIERPLTELRRKRVHSGLDLRHNHRCVATAIEDGGPRPEVKLRSLSAGNGHWMARATQVRCDDQLRERERLHNHFRFADARRQLSRRSTKKTRDGKQKHTMISKYKSG